MQSVSNSVKSKIESSNKTTMHLDHGKRSYDNAFQALDAELEHFLRSKSAKKSKKNNNQAYDKAKESATSRNPAKQHIRTNYDKKINRIGGIQQEVQSANKTYEPNSRKSNSQHEKDNYGRQFSQNLDGSFSLSKSNSQVMKTPVEIKRILSDASKVTPCYLANANPDKKSILPSSSKKSPRKDNHKNTTVKDRKTANCTKDNPAQLKSTEDILVVKTSSNYVTKDNSTSKMQINYHAELANPSKAFSLENLAQKTISDYSRIDRSIAMFAKSIASATRGAKIIHRKSVHCQRKDSNTYSTKSSKTDMQYGEVKSLNDVQPKKFEGISRPNTTSEKKQPPKQNSSHKSSRQESENNKNKCCKNSTIKEVCAPTLPKNLQVQPTKNLKNDKQPQLTKKETLITPFSSSSQQLKIMQKSVFPPVKTEEISTKDVTSTTQPIFQTLYINQDNNLIKSASPSSSSGESSDDSDSSSSDTESSSTDSDVEAIDEPNIPVKHTQNISEINRTKNNSAESNHKLVVSTVQNKELLPVGRIDNIPNVTTFLSEDSNSEDEDDDSDVEIEQQTPKHSQPKNFPKVAVETVPMQTYLNFPTFDDGTCKSVYKNGYSVATTSNQSLTFLKNEDLSDISDAPLDPDDENLNIKSDVEVKRNPPAQETKSALPYHQSRVSNVDTKDQINVSACPPLETTYQFLDKANYIITEAVDIQEDFEEQVVPDQNNSAARSTLEKELDTIEPIDFEVSSKAFQEMFAEFLYTPEGLSPIPESIQSDELGPIPLSVDDLFSDLVTTNEDYITESVRNDSNPSGLDVNQPHWNIPSKQELGQNRRIRHIMNESPRSCLSVKSSKSSTKKSGSLKLTFKRSHKDDWSVISSEDAAYEARSEEFNGIVDLSVFGPCKTDANITSSNPKGIKPIKANQRTKLPLDCRDPCKINTINKVYIERVLKNNGVIILKT